MTASAPVGLARRASAFLVDVGGTVLVTLVVVLSLATIAYSGATRNEPLGNVAVTLILLIPAASFLLNLVLAWLTGATVGQRMLSLRVVDRTTGEPIGLGRTIVRSLILLAPAVLQLALSPLTNEAPAVVGTLLNLIAPLGWLVMLFAAVAGKGVGWHDRVAKSVVIDPRAVTP